MYCVLMVFRCASYCFISAECGLSPLLYRQLAVNMWQDQDNATPAIHTRAVRHVLSILNISRTDREALM